MSEKRGGMEEREEEKVVQSVVVVSHYNNLIKRFRRYTLSSIDATVSSAVSNGAAASGASTPNSAALWRSFEPHKLKVKNTGGQSSNGAESWALVGNATKINCSLSLSLSYKPLSPSTPQQTRAGSVTIELALNLPPPSSDLNSSVPDGLISILPPYPSFYWRGSLVEMIVANPAVIGALSETTSLSLSSADALVISISRLEDILISKKTEVVTASLVEGGSEPQQQRTDQRFFWVIKKVCSFGLKAARLFHTCPAFPLLYGAAQPQHSFQVLTNIDRNTLYPKYPATDALMTALLEKLRKLFTKERWGLLTFDKHELKRRTASATRSDYEAYGAELLALANATNPIKGLSTHGSLTCAASFQVCSTDAAGALDRCSLDLASIISESSSGRAQLLQLAKFLVLSKFPTVIEPAASTSANNNSSDDAKELYQKTKKKFGQLIAELGKINGVVAQISDSQPAVFNPFIAGEKGLSRLAPEPQLAKPIPVQSTMPPSSPALIAPSVDSAPPFVAHSNDTAFDDDLIAKVLLDALLSQHVGGPI
eukprot:TRINITY_DN14242_c0_g1_i1.p1 TRINITY_DN14242_c0_g1~~TRINITY_DN14242_c0_g1_i1.p1  ORF type:complete len:540 (+),score=94.73 TRINITY_DN14242_c0_g1_i1:41-1660(+)